jgi:AbrB family looped-hinge helix DNA binding protein
MSLAAKKSVVQLSPRGQITLPADVRKEVGFSPGDTLVLKVEDGRVVLEAAMVLPVERYSDKRIQDFAEAAHMSDKELARARRAWGL